MALVGLAAGGASPSLLAQCDPPTMFRVWAEDGGRHDYLGRGVAIRGDVIVCGATDNDENGVDAGAAYVFDAETGAQRLKLLAGDGAADDRFGYAVAIGTDVILVGAGGSDTHGDSSGAAYVFDASTGAQLHKLSPADGSAGDDFGSSLAIDGDLAIIGALSDADNGDRSGSAYLFDVTTGEEIAKLLPDDDDVGDYFGRSVSISGNRVVVGAYLDDDVGIGSGSAYLFDITDPSQPVQIAKLIPDDNAEGDWFGVSCGISGNVAIVGAHLHDHLGSNAGAAYLFDATTGAQLAELLAIGGSYGDLFGWTVAIDGPLALVGAQWRDDLGDSSGAAYLFDVTTGEQISALLAPDGQAGDEFGYSVRLQGSRAVIGAPRDRGNLPVSGSAYIIDTTDTRMGLWSAGRCPGHKFFRVTSATPGARCAVLLSFGQGQFTIPPNHPCSGEALCLGRAVRVARTGTADELGIIRFDVEIAAPYCGRIELQALDLSSCRISNVLLVE